MGPTAPAYTAFLERGELQQRALDARRRMGASDLCARACRVDRSQRLGACRTGAAARVASFGAHHGEEDPLRGWAGSGTIFFASCNLRCQYCQNHDISQGTAGVEVSAEQLAGMMLSLQAQGCHNINLVSPSHVVAPILEAIYLAACAGLRLPLVYNTGGYDSLEALALLDGVIDIYMPDMKYSDTRTARRYSRVMAYPEANRRAVREMHRQVGALAIDERGLAVRGLLVRHLVLPNDLAGTSEIVRFLAQEVSPDTYLNLMDQYRPAFRAFGIPLLNRRISQEEYQSALREAYGAGLTRLDGSAPRRLQGIDN
jgi:putative pyruvate formate lyase activating enzyme